MYTKFKERALKNKFFRFFCILLIAVFVFCRLVKRYYVAWRKDCNHTQDRRLIFGKLFHQKYTRTAICTILAAALFCGAFVKSSAADPITNTGEKDIIFSYARGIDKQLFDGQLDLDNSVITEYPKEGILKEGAFQMTVQSDGFEGDLYEDMEDVIYPLVICNSGSNILTNIRIETDKFRLFGYDDKFSELLQRAALLQRQVTPQDASPLQLVSPDESISELSPDMQDIFLQEIPDVQDTSVQKSSTESEMESTDIKNQEASDEEALAVWKEVDNASLKLEDLAFSLYPEEKVTLYLTLPEEYTSGVYKDQIRVGAEEFSDMYVMDVMETIYAREGAPWQTTPDKTAPVVSYEEEKASDMIQLSDGFDFQVLEQHEEDSGISQVDCYLNGKLLELEPEKVGISQRDDQKILQSETYHVDFAEPGIQNLLIRATDQKGNRNVCELEISAICEEKYHVTMPDKIQFTVDPDMAYGDSQIYNTEDFIIENKSKQNIMVTIESLDINNNKFGSGSGGICSLDMLVLIDGEEYCSVPVTEIVNQDLCQFLLGGNEALDGEQHQASLVFKGNLESDEIDDWQNGNIDIQYQIKFSVIE